MDFVALGCLGIALFGLFGVSFSKSLLMKIVGLDVMNTGVVSFFVAIAFRSGSRAPIFVGDGVTYAHPVPQAIIVTAIVIAFATLSLSLTYAMILAQRRRSFDVEYLEKEEGE